LEVGSGFDFQVSKKTSQIWIFEYNVILFKQLMLRRNNTILGQAQRIALTGGSFSKPMF